MYRSMKLIRKLMEYTECLWLTPARPAPGGDTLSGSGFPPGWQPGVGVAARPAGPRRFSPSG